MTIARRDSSGCCTVCGFDKCAVPGDCSRQLRYLSDQSKKTTNTQIWLQYLVDTALIAWEATRESIPPSAPPLSMYPVAPYDAPREAFKKAIREDFAELAALLAYVSTIPGMNEKLIHEVEDTSGRPEKGDR